MGQAEKESQALVYQEQSPEQTMMQAEVFSRNPTKALQEMGKVVQAMSQQCTGKEFVSIIQGRKYPRVEWWTTVGATLGLFPVTEYSRRLDREDEMVYEARVTVQRNGQVITAGEALCSSEERNWKNRDEYAIKSMAITRATGKAYRTGLSMLAVMAGLEGTPAEEMPADSSSFSSNHHNENMMSASDQQVSFAKQLLQSSVFPESERAQYEEKIREYAEKKVLESKGKIRSGMQRASDLIEFLEKEIRDRKEMQKQEAEEAKTEGGELHE